MVDSVTETSKGLLQEQLKGMKKEALIQALDEWFGWKPDREMTREELAEILLKLQRKRIEEAQAKNLEAAEALATDDDPVVRVRFQNLDAPGADLEFTYAGPEGFKVVETKGPYGEVSKTVLPARKFHLYDNEEADVPLSVYEHLNSLRVPEAHFDTDEHGFVRGVRSGFRSRFTCQLVLTPNQKKRLGMKGAE